MKGPYERLKWELRRIWECPVCHHREKSPGTAVTRLCPCQDRVPPPDQSWMKLIETDARQSNS